jgi:SAM-dependent methyltransferase
VSEQEARRISFGRVADAYERSRPEYPAAAVRWLLGPRRLRVLDLGAGTGKLTRRLVELGHDVVAVEPLAEMRERIAVAPALEGTAEAIPAEAASFDAVTAGQAFHWFDPARALPEIARVLRPGGVLGLIWNRRDLRIRWVAALEEALRDERDWVEPLGSQPPGFGSVERRDFEWALELDLARLLRLVRSRSSYAVASPAEQRRTIDEVRALVRSHPELRDRARFALPYVTQAYRIPRA